MLILLVAIYAFYILWHTETGTLSKNTPASYQETEKHRGNTQTPSKTSKSSLSASTHIQTQMAEEEQKRIEEIEKATQKNPPKVPTPSQTQAIYDALTPEEHTETMTAAKEAFERLDRDVAELDEKLALERETVEQNKQEGDTEEAEESVSGEVTLEMETETVPPVANTEDTIVETESTTASVEITEEASIEEDSESAEETEGLDIPSPVEIEEAYDR